MNPAIQKLQTRLAELGHNPGAADGIGGPGTAKALQAFFDKQGLAFSVSATRDEITVKGPLFSQPRTLGRWPKQSDVPNFFGPVGGPESTAGRVNLPMPFYLAWDKGVTIKTFACHSKVASALTSIFDQTFAHYGAARMAELALNCFGGCFNKRKMRGGTAWSMHSWGIAVDLDPERNQLTWGRDRAVFARPEYEAFWNIVEAHGAKSLGRSENRDWQHFQFAT